MTTGDSAESCATLETVCSACSKPYLLMKYELAKWLRSMGGQRARLTIITSLMNKLLFLTKFICSYAGDCRDYSVVGQKRPNRSGDDGGEIENFAKDDSEHPAAKHPPTRNRCPWQHNIRREVL
ncbi:hypothetical protein KL86DES1_10077 [uncultured Desulfovibrio sp.]|uniref:Uncharacterized protein n=1 Tax=uncultured Desulfovibrio sp. TaxID=167968 RepID=A0A212KXD3_9BACT|nr:hypothetical protein KL86DES1_10077 [uncultured Desulfovibrio sp.]VZH35289.1 conserved protein of unknown function [Desulfovibrio sp. 86]